MFRKLLSMVSLFLGCSSSALAGLYIAPLLNYVNLTNNGESARYQGLAPKFEVGYDIPITPFYLAVEVGVIPLKPLTIHNIAPAANESLKPTYMIDISVVPGVDLDGYIHAWARAGFVRTQFENYGTQSTGEVGAGIDILLTGCWSLRGEYIFQVYKSFADIGTVQNNTLSAGVVFRLW